MSKDTISIQDFLTYLVKSIVSFPQDVIIEKNMNSYDETYIIHVNNSDMGLIIGKGGKNINSIRNIVSIKSFPNKIFIQLNESAES